MTACTWPSSVSTRYTHAHGRSASAHCCWAAACVGNLTQADGYEASGVWWIHQ